MEMELESVKGPYHKPTPEGSDVGDGESLPLIEQEHPYPVSIFFIIANEFCERFSYYGMRVILTLYLRNVLLYTEDSATIVFHTFIMICYITPFLGAYISDAHIGKFKTIFYFSIIHAVGNILLSIASFKNPPVPAVAFSLIGLGLTALGTGGIKPCVSAFGGDQFVIPGQESQLQQYFFVFYFTINLGGVLSEFVAPMLRKDVSCQGEDTCYPLAFGVPALLMILALVIFILGKPLYKIREPTGNVIMDIGRCVKYALSNKKTEKQDPDAHWLDSASDKFEPEFIEDVKTVFRIIVLFSPLPIFWALYEQQGSRWTFQATRMNGYITEHFTIKPDQMQVVNAVLCLLLIPVFERVIYPLLERCNILVNPLKRLSLGAFVVAISFIMAGILELKMEPTYAVIPGSMESNVNFVNSLPCSLNITLAKSRGGPGFEPDPPPQILRPYENAVFHKLRSWTYEVNIVPSPYPCNVGGANLIFSPTEIELYPEQATSVIVKKTAADEVTLLTGTGLDSLEKSPESDSKIRVILDRGGGQANMVMLDSPGKNYSIDLPEFHISSTAEEVRPHLYSVSLLTDGSLVKQSLGNITLDQGGSYLIAVFPNYTATDAKEMMMKLYTLTPYNSIHMMYIMPQFVTITIGELLFAITGFDFSYSEAPHSMKSVIQSIWLFTIALGNIIVIVVTALDVFGREAVQFFTFAVLMFVGNLIFMYLAAGYKIRSTRWNLSKEEKDT